MAYLFSFNLLHLDFKSGDFLYARLKQFITFFEKLLVTKPELFIVHKNPVSFRIFSKTDGYVFIFC